MNIRWQVLAFDENTQEFLGKNVPPRSKDPKIAALFHSDEVLIWVDQLGPLLGVFNDALRQFVIRDAHVKQNRITHFASINAPISF